MLITSHELLPKFRQILTAKTDKIRTIIYMENPIQRTDLSGYRQVPFFLLKIWCSLVEQFAETLETQYVLYFIHLIEEVTVVFAGTQNHHY